MPLSWIVIPPKEASCRALKRASLSFRACSTFLRSVISLATEIKVLSSIIFVFTSTGSKSPFFVLWTVSKIITTFSTNVLILFFIASSSSMVSSSFTAMPQNSLLEYPYSFIADSFTVIILPVFNSWIKTESVILLKRVLKCSSLSLSAFSAFFRSLISITVKRNFWSVSETIPSIWT